MTASAHDVEASRIVVKFNRLSDPTLVESKLDG